MSEVKTPKPRLAARRGQLEYEYALAGQGLAKGIVLTVIGYSMALAVVAGNVYTLIERGEGFLTGNQIVVIFLILNCAIVAYYSFVFGRIVTLRAELKETEKQIEFNAGESVRSEADE